MRQEHLTVRCCCALNASRPQALASWHEAGGVSYGHSDRMPMPADSSAVVIACGCNACVAHNQLLPKLRCIDVSLLWLPHVHCQRACIATRCDYHIARATCHRLCLALGVAEAECFLQGRQSMRCAHIERGTNAPQLTAQQLITLTRAPEATATYGS